MIHDIAIVGAGPAGAMAARKLEELGANYIILDRAEFPRNKPCAGVLSPKIHSLLDIPEDVIERPLKGYRVFGPSKDIVESSFPEPGCIVQRDKFDEFLIKDLKNPVVNSHIFEIEDMDDHYLLKGRSGDVKARYVIGAEGTASVARRICDTQIDKIAISAQYEFGLDEDLVDDRIGNWFEVYYLMEYGYGWISPMKGGVKVGIGILSDRKPDIWGMIELFINNPLVAPKVEDGVLLKKEAHSIPMSGPLQTLSCGRILLTGDAGGFVYPGTGEGIYYAMRSGQIAAEITFEHMGNSEIDLAKAYDEKLEAAGLLGLRDIGFIEDNLASPEKADKYVKRLKFLASRG